MKLGLFNVGHAGGSRRNIVVSRAGSDAYNGRYRRTGEYNGKPQYIHVTTDGLAVSWDGAKWIMTGGAFLAYKNLKTSVNSSFWELGDIGEAPAPRVVFG